MNYMDESDFCPKCGKHWAYCECISGELKEPIKIAIREPGYYWVKREKKDKWRPTLWHEDGYWIWAMNAIFDTDFYKINETRILNPDEVKEYENREKHIS